MSLFRFQAKNNALYRSYLDSLKVATDSVKALHQIPFLPISLFKYHAIQTEEWPPETEYLSSGTTGKDVSRHLIRDTSFYLDNARRCFEYFFGSLNDYHILALLPSYLERENSSLVAMIRHFIAVSKSVYSGFYLHNDEKLLKNIEVLRNRGDRKIILWGVSFALLDLAERFGPDLHDCLIFETGGMKGRRKEITRHELHGYLTTAFQIPSVFSEYGMTELLSQAYTRGGDRFFCPPTLKILVREITDPFEVGISAMGGINVIDLANIHSIAFIETEDLGQVYPDGSFEVAGRIDNSDVRGCNLMMEV